MGPRSDERGNLDLKREKQLNVWLLQWGRAQMSAEMVHPPRYPLLPNSFNGAALR